MLSVIKQLGSFQKKHPDAADALNNWYAITEVADWANFNEVRKIFNSADQVGNDRYVFNIRGNNYRLIVLIHFNIRTVYVLFAGTHVEYSKIDAPTVKFKK